MKKPLIYLLLIFFALQVPLHSYSSNPKDFIKELGIDAITKLSDKNISNDEKRKFIEKLAIENVDVKSLGLYTLGELRKSADENNLNTYQMSFKKYFLKSLTSRLTDYSSSEFEILEEIKKSNTYTIIKSKITPDDGGPKLKLTEGLYKKSCKTFN